MHDYRSMIGTIIGGRYLLISIIGQGGMAVVFNAFDRHTGNTVAVKMLNENSGDNDLGDLAARRKQFADEIAVHSRLSHPGIVGFVEARLDSVPMYFVMEYIDGITLKEYIKRKRILPAREMLDISCQLLSALAHIHSKNIVHCDIKPHNIILMRNGKIKLTDFGIARIEGKLPDLPPNKAVGTVYYVSPEQAEGKVLDHRSDLYSLGIMMYEMSTGQLPFNGSDLDRVAEMQSSAPPTRPRHINSKISKGLEQIILKAIAKKPYMRFNSADEMRRYLEILKRNPSSVFRLQSKGADGDSRRRSGRYHLNSAHSMLIGICAAFIIVAAIAVPIIHNRILKGTNGDSIVLSVPDVIGSKYTNAVNSVDDRYYDVDIIYVYNSKSEPGIVVSQSPAPHERVEINPFEEQCTITISVSAEVRELTVIEVISLSPEEASNALRREGYTVNFMTVYSDTVPKGLVCGTLPAAGEKALGGSTVTIYVSMGAEIINIKVPQFVGLSESEAAEKLKACGLTVGKITYKASSEPIGTVISQSLPVDQAVHKGTAIDLVISGGPNFIS